MNNESSTNLPSEQETEQLHVTDELNQDTNESPNELLDSEQGSEETTEQVIEQSSEEAPDMPPAEEKISFTRSAFEFLEMFAFSVFAVLIIFTFFLRLCRVDGASMENTLHNGESLLLSSIAYTPKQDDIIVFHITNTEDHMEKTMVKRVIATEGQELIIDFDEAVITVDGVVYEDSHKVLKDLNGRTLDYYILFANHHYSISENTLTATIPEGHVFVMGDNRNNSKDSRNSDVGFVDERCILGKVVLRFSPFTIFD